MTEARRDRHSNIKTKTGRGSAGGKVAPVGGNDIGSGHALPPDADLPGIFAALDHTDIGILLLDATLRTVYMNRPFRDLWIIPDVLASGRPSFHDLARHVETTRWREVAP